MRIENPVDAILRDLKELQVQLYTGNTDEACEAIMAILAYKSLIKNDQVVYDLTRAFLLETINGILEKSSLSSAPTRKPSTRSRGFLKKTKLIYSVAPILISASTPDGRLRFCRLSMVFGLGFCSDMLI